MRSPRLYLFSLLVAAGALVLIVTGAIVTSLHDHPQPFYTDLHRNLSFAVAAIMAAFLTALIAAREARWRIIVTAIVLIAGAINGYLGTNAVLGSSPANIGTLHAWISAMLFCAIAVVTWSLSPFFERGSERVTDQGWPSLKSITTAGVLLVLTQIELGAAYRHNVLSVIPHLLAAPAVALVVMVAGAFVYQQFPKHESLRPLAVAVLVITSIQIALGMVTFVIGILYTNPTAAFAFARVGHVATGSIALAICTILAIEIRRKVERKTSD